MRRSTLLLLSLALVALAGCQRNVRPGVAIQDGGYETAPPATSSNLPQPPPPAAPPATAAVTTTPAPAAQDSESRPKNRAEEIAEKIQKEVEELRGISMDRPVKIGVYDPATLKAFLLKHAESEMSEERLGPYVRGLKALGIVPPDLDFKKVMLEVLNEQIAGFYDPDTKELRLIDRSAAGAESKKTGGATEAAQKMMARMGIDEDAVIMAHELTHALQDQYAGLKNLPIEVRDDDDLATASMAVIEGDATLAMMAWTFVKMKQSPKMLFSKLVSSQIDQFMDVKSIPGAEAVANAPAFLQESLLFPYLSGLKFCIAIGMKDKNFKPVDAALKAPPLSTEQIIHPEKFAGDALDYPMTLTVPDLSEALGAKRETTNTLGELFTRVLFAEKLDKDLSAKAAAGWDGDRYALYGSPGADSVVWATTWDTAEDADEAEAALKSWLAATHPGATSEDSDVTSARFGRPDGRLDAVARKGGDVFLLRGIPKDRIVAVLRALFDGTKKVERRKV